MTNLEILKKADLTVGLSTAEAAEQLARLGPNALPEQPPEPVWTRFVRQFNSPLIFILLFALAFDLGLWVYEGALGWPIEATAISLILLFNAALGLYQEQRSEAALARLKALAGAQAWVLRGRVRSTANAQHRAGRLGAAGVGRSRPCRRRPS